MRVIHQIIIVTLFLTNLFGVIPNKKTHQEDALVNVTVYDMMGRRVKTLINSKQTAGYWNIRWNGTNTHGESVSAGMYIYTIRAGEFNKTKKMVLLK
jgi:flagellar hook assembly protein FlgD